jgi:AcrR family transcriptional regulator
MRRSGDSSDEPGSPTVGARRRSTGAPAVPDAPRTARSTRRAPDAPRDSERRTRGGWAPVGTAAVRRAEQQTRGTGRGKKTRSEIIAAARRVFERSGYFEANVEAIVTEAGVARGSFYTYFPSKVEVFQVIASEAIFQIMDSVGEADDERNVDAHVRLERSNRRYLEAFKSNARIYTLFDQVAATDPVVRDLHLRSRRFHIARVASTIGRWQARGLADASIDATTTAAALVSMTSHFAHWLYVGGDDQYDEETAIRTLTDIWIRATGLRALADETV